MAAVTAWAVAFAVTQLVEVPIYLVLTRSFRVAFVASLLTHPVVWFAFPLVPVRYEAQVALAECFAVLVEAWWLARAGVRRSLRWSLLANGTSLLLGLLLRARFGVP